MNPERGPAGGEAVSGADDAIGRATYEDDIGRAVHAKWKRWRIEGGYPDHAFKMAQPGAISSLDVCAVCDKDYVTHHGDMIDWDDLSPVKRAKYIVQGLAAVDVERARWVLLVRALSQSVRASEQAAKRWEQVNRLNDGQTLDAELKAANESVARALAALEALAETEGGS